MTDKLTISTNDKRISLEVENSSLIFWKIMALLQLGNEPLAPKIVQTDKQETSPAVVASAPLVPSVAPQPQKYKGFGFLYIKCEHCGEIKGFHSKQDIDCYFCKSCGKATTFTEPLVPLRFRCECGSGFKYLTNLDDDMFDIACLDCKSPVTVEYNGKVKEYRGCRG